MPSSRLLVLVLVVLSQQARARPTVPLADSVVVSKSRGAKSVATQAGKPSHRVQSFTPQSAVWAPAQVIAAARRSANHLPPAGQKGPPDMPFAQDTRSVGPEKAQSHAGLSAIVEGVDLPDTSFCPGGGVILSVLGPVVSVLDASTGLDACSPFDLSVAFNSSLIGTQCSYDPATSKFYLAATNGSHILVAVSEDPASRFLGPFAVQANGINHNFPGQALPGLEKCLADPEGACKASNMEVSTDTSGFWVTVQLLDISALPVGSLLISIPKVSLTFGKPSMPPYVTYSNWAAPDASVALDLHLSHAQADGSHAAAEKGTFFVLADYFGNSSILIWAITNTASLRNLALGDDTLLPVVSDVSAVPTYPVVAPSSIASLVNTESSGGAIQPDFWSPGLSSVTFDHNTGYLWTAAPTAITINGGEAVAGATYFVIKPNIVAGQFEVQLIAQGYTTFSSGSHGAAFLSPVITVDARQYARLFGVAYSSNGAFAQAYVPVSLNLGPGAVVSTVKDTWQGADGRSTPMAGHAGIDSDGSFWMMSGAAEKQQTGCSGTTSCNAVQTTITCFQSKATIEPPAQAPAAPTEMPKFAPINTAATAPATAPASGTATAPPVSSATDAAKLLDLAVPPAQPGPSAPSSNLLPWPFAKPAAAVPLPPTTTAAPSAAPATQQDAPAAKPLGAELPTPFGLQFPKLPSFGATPQKSLMPDNQSSLKESVGMVEKGLAPPSGPFQLPKLPFLGQQPDKSIQSGGKATPWGFKLPFSFQAAAAPELAYGLVDLNGPAEAPDLAVLPEAAHMPVADAPSAAALPQEVAWQLQAPSREAAPSVDSSGQQALAMGARSEANLLSAPSPDTGMGPVRQPGAALGDNAPLTSPPRAAQFDSDRMDTDTVLRAVEILFLAEGASAGQDKALHAASNPSVAQVPSQSP